MINEIKQKLVKGDCLKSPNNSGNAFSSWEHDDLIHPTIVTVHGSVLESAGQNKV